MRTSKKKKCKDCGEPITIIGEYPPLEWCEKCGEYKNLKESTKELEKEFTTIEIEENKDEI